MRSVRRHSHCQYKARTTHKRAHKARTERPNHTHSRARTLRRIPHCTLSQALLRIFGLPLPQILMCNSIYSIHSKSSVDISFHQESESSHEHGTGAPCAYCHVAPPSHPESAVKSPPCPSGLPTDHDSVCGQTRGTWPTAVRSAKRPWHIKA